VPFGSGWMNRDVAVANPNALADALRRQSLAFGAGDAALRNIERLRHGARAVITGQQVGLFGGPLLTPAFTGAALLLFANALSAFATIEAWENQIPYVVPQSISGSLISEVGLANVHQGDALALGLIVVVVIVMTGYFLLQRRAARWQG